MKTFRHREVKYLAQGHTEPELRPRQPGSRVHLPNHDAMLGSQVGCEALMIPQRAPCRGGRGKLLPGHQPPLSSLVPAAFSPLSPDPAPVLGDGAGSFAGLTLLPFVYPHGYLASESPRGPKAGRRCRGRHCLLRIDRIHTSVFLVTAGSNEHSVCICV